MSRVLVLGTNGMLGAMIADILAQSREHDLTLTRRNPDHEPPSGPARTCRCLPFDAEKSPEAIEEILAQGFDWIVNAIGVIKPFIKDTDPSQIERAVRVNALFPLSLARAAERHGSRVLQIATDCVYSGRKGLYAEEDAHDALDTYGKTKSLGEVPSPAVSHIRCSIIGPEMKGHLSLLAWFLGQPPAARLTGYVNHHWNGITTYHFARICHGIIRTGLVMPGLIHVIPDGIVTKAEMLEGFANAYGRNDLNIQPGEAPVVIDRTLTTSHPDLNLSLWSSAGYSAPPNFRQMMEELSHHPFNQ